MILYRPVGQAEYDLIAATDFSAYPPRLPEQPIFYPVLNERYAREICDKWNRRRADARIRAMSPPLRSMTSMPPVFPFRPWEPATIRSFGSLPRSWKSSTGISSEKFASFHKNSPRTAVRGLSYSSF